jgi:PIN domain nuclease of toxin-antitoxin system
VEGAAVKYLLDTAPWINGVTLPQTLPRHIQRLLAADDRKGLCRISLLEAAILHRLGRLEFEGTLLHFFAAGVSDDIELLDLTPAIAAGTSDLPRDFRGDPFDRAIVATAAALDLTLVTTDAAIRDAAACAVIYYPFRQTRSRK